jgi:mannose-6-phosphate isomerase-like protein (cupin superfamily)
MHIHELPEIVRGQAATGDDYTQFLNAGSLSAGHYALAAGSEDPQAPHDEDEVYYVVSGRAMIRVGDEEHAVQPGTLVFVAAQVPHRFYDIREDLSLLVFFAPEHQVVSAE